MKVILMHRDIMALHYKSICKLLRSDDLSGCAWGDVIFRWDFTIWGISATRLLYRSMALLARGRFMPHLTQWHNSEAVAFHFQQPEFDPDIWCLCMWSLLILPVTSWACLGCSGFIPHKNTRKKEQILATTDQCNHGMNSCVIFSQPSIPDVSIIYLAPL